ncbi:hypothetical protein J1605_018811 [Eschrichtius robustus]|uniref:Uncharacterized protein n=1 Tax=Eschrichtius robustus TaxID=9764 RepID=A0AB34HUN8_ESCRO|nr:hypothetical protein J1605_018811 [Eschrichtius robustus]
MHPATSSRTTANSSCAQHGSCDLHRLEAGFPRVLPESPGEAQPPQESGKSALLCPPMVDKLLSFRTANDRLRTSS